MKILLVCIALALIGASAGVKLTGASFPQVVASGVYSSSFPADENPISQGGIWVNGLTNGIAWNDNKTLNGNAVATVGNFPVNRYADDISHLTKAYHDFTNDQYGEATVWVSPGYTGNGGKHEVEILLRFEITANNARGYEMLVGLNEMAIVRWNGPAGNYTSLWNSTQSISVTGDVYKATIIGNTIRAYKNGNLVGTVNDSTYSEGQPGIGFWPVDGAIPGNLGWSDLVLGELPEPGFAGLAVGALYLAALARRKRA